LPLGTILFTLPLFALATVKAKTSASKSANTTIHFDAADLSAALKPAIDLVTGSRVLFIPVIGAGLSGKSTLANRITNDYPEQTILIHGDEVYSAYKAARETPELVSGLATSSYEPSRIIINDRKYISEQKLPFSLYLGRFLTKLIAQNPDKKVLVWDASEIDSDINYALTNDASLRNLPLDILSVQVEKLTNDLRFYSISPRQELGRVSVQPENTSAAAKLFAAAPLLAIGHIEPTTALITLGAIGLAL